MHVIKVRNVNQALNDGLWWLHVSGLRSDSRNGPVLVSPEPVTTVYMKPKERVLFSSLRDANPFFHLMESLWMLAGRHDVAFPAHFAKQIAEYSDDGKTLHGAYGYRWVNYFGRDQLHEIANELRRDPTSRRCVLSMWDGLEDPHHVAIGGKDVPCNTHAYFGITHGALDMTVCCRSNDAVWGAYGANAVHFSFLLEYLASAIGVPVGVYRQISNNFHIYADRPDVRRLHDERGTPVVSSDDRYSGGLYTVPLMHTYPDEWQRDLQVFMRMFDMGIPTDNFANPFFSLVAYPMALAHSSYKAGDYEAAMHHLEQVASDDWRMACQEWIIRRKAVAQMKGKL